MKLSNAFLELADTGLGQFITKTALLGGTAWGLSSLLRVAKIIPAITLQFKNLASVMGMISNPAVVSSIGGIGTALSTVGGFAGVALPVLLAVGAAIVGIYEGVKAYNEYVESHKFENLVAHFEELDEQAKDAADKLEDVKKRLDELNGTPTKDRGQDWQNEIDKLETLKQYYEYIAQMRQSQASEAQAEAYNAPVETGTTVTRKSVEVQGRTAQIKLDDIGKYTNESSAVYELAAKENIQYTEKQAAALSKLTDETEIAAQGYQYLKENLESLGYIFSNTTQTAEEYTLAQSSAMKGLAADIIEAANYGDKLSQLQKDEYEGYVKSNQGRYEYIKGLEDASVEQQEFASNYEKMVENFIRYSIRNHLMDTTDAVVYLTNVLPDGAQAAIEYAQAVGLIGKDVTLDSLGLVELANGALALKENCYQATDGLYYLKDGCDALAGSGDGAADALNQIEVAAYDTSTAAAQLTASLFDQNGQLTTAAQTALSVDGSMVSLAQSELQAQQAAAQANYANLVLEIEKVGSTAMITAGQLQNMIALAGVQGTMASMSGEEQVKYNKMLYYQSTGKKADQNIEEYNKWTTDMLQKNADATYDRIMSETQEKLNQLKDYVPAGTGGDGSSGKSAEEKAAEEAEKQAKKAQQAQEKAASESQKAYESAASSAEQAAQQAAQAAEQAAEEAKQKILDSIQELKDASDDFWDSKTDAIEETNKELDRQKQLEEKLKALEEARQKKILLYKNGQFQYDKDYGTIAKAQADYEETRDKIQRERELEQLEEMKDNATEIFNEMKDIISNGGDVTQDMINSWLSQMQADGVNYYDSNKQMLSEWLDWAKDNIGEFIQSTSETLSGYAASGGLSSTARGAYGTNASTKGEGYLNDPKYWKNGEFVGLSVAWWMDIFERQIKKGQLGDYTTTDAWLGEIPGSSVFDDWKEVLEYWAKKDGGDPYAMQDMLERFEAAQIVLSNYVDIFKSLGRTDLADLADKYKDLDVSAYYREAILKGVAAHPTDPFGWQSMTPAYRGTEVTTSGQLWRLMSDIIDLDTYLKDYTGVDSPYKTAFGQAFLHSKRDWHINRFDESDRYEFAEFDTEVLKAAYEENEDAIRNLSEAWFNATKDYEREAIHAQAELRREARDRMEELLGYEPSGRSEAERQANRESSVSLFEKKKAQVAEKNTEDIKDYLSQIKEGSNISQKYIDNAREYIGNLIEENSKKWFDLYDQTEKDKLHEQNEQYRAILEQLERAEQVGNVTGGGLNPWEKELESADEWLVERVKELEAQMAANSKAWWETEDEAERKRLHEENERLAAEIDQLTGTTSTYEGHTGTWSWSGSSNARGTHNFMPKGESGISLVGENGPELRVLTRGDNIIPADQTENLWKWSNITPQAVLTTLSSKSGNGNTSYAFDVSRIELPNVTDAKSFVQGLKNYALQYSYKR